MNYFMEPINLEMWPMFEKVTGVNHVECFLATSEMKKGDILFLHVGRQVMKYESGIYAVGEIISNPYILHNSPGDYCNEKNTVDVRILKIDYKEPFVTHGECLGYINQFRTAHKMDYEKGTELYRYIFGENVAYSYNAKRVNSKEDWKKVLKNEKQENNVMFDIFNYMLSCKKYTTNGVNIQKALGLNGIPNLDVYRFGQRVINLLGIPEQVRINNEKMYWNIPFETDYERNIGSTFTWRLRPELVEALKEEWNLTDIEINSIDLDLKEYMSDNNPDEYEKRIKYQVELRDEFVTRFNISKLISMPIDDFVIGRSQIDETGKNAFCYVLETQMRELGEMRGATVDKFGVWFSKDGKYEHTSKYGDNIEDAYKSVIKAICELIVAGNKDDYQSIEKSLIPPLFKGKILSTYYPEKYIPIFKEDDVDKFLNILDITYDVHEYNTLEKKKRLLKTFKNSHDVLSKYSDYYFVRFLYGSYKKELKEEHTVNGEIDYNFEIVDFDYIGKHVTERRNIYRSRETDYERINRNKKDIGNRGENAVLKFEKNNLISLGLYELANRVELSDNDAAGFDIISYNPDGTEKHIEVKTNSGSSNKVMDFYLTDNELDKMENDPCYNLYYLFNIKKNPKIHIVNKKILSEQKDILLQPVLYKVTIDVETKK